MGMKLAILWSGNAAALLGMALCTVSGIVRLSGVYTLAGVELRTLFLLGVGLMVFACLAKIHLLSDGRNGTE